MFGRIDHIGVAVEDLDESIALYGERLGMALQHRETVEEQGVEAVLLGVGESHVELLRPLAADTPVGRFLAKRGPGMHHVALEVGDVAAAVEHLSRAGAHVIDLEPRRGFGGHEVSFVHPETLHGVLVEVVADGR